MKNLNEKFEKLDDTYEIYATDTVNQLISFLKGKPKPYRIIYDSSINYYFIGDANNLIHLDILETAYDNGFYPELFSKNEVQDYIEEKAVDEELLLFAFYPDEDRAQDIEKSSDGYTRKYIYDFGVIYSHELTPLENFPIYSKLGKPIKKEYVYDESFKGEKRMKNMHETLQEIGEDTFATNSEQELISLMKNASIELQVIYDPSIGYYFINEGNDEDIFELDFIEKIAEGNFYPDMFSNNEIQDYFDDKLFDGELLSFVFHPGMDSLNIDDVFERFPVKYQYDFGVIHTSAASYLEDFPLYSKLGKPLNRIVTQESFNLKKLNKLLKECLG